MENASRGAGSDRDEIPWRTSIVVLSAVTVGLALPRMTEGWYSSVMFVIVSLACVMASKMMRNQMPFHVREIQIGLASALILLVLFLGVAMSASPDRLALAVFALIAWFSVWLPIGRNGLALAATIGGVGVWVSTLFVRDHESSILAALALLITGISAIAARERPGVLVVATASGLPEIASRTTATSETKTVPLRSATGTTLRDIVAELQRRVMQNPTLRSQEIEWVTRGEQCLVRGAREKLLVWLLAFVEVGARWNGTSDLRIEFRALFERGAVRVAIDVDDMLCADWPLCSRALDELGAELSVRVERISGETGSTILVAWLPLG